MHSFKRGELVVDPGATILLEESASPHLYTILEGWAFRHKQIEDGRRQVLNFALPGDLVGLQLAIMNEMQHTVTALTRTRLCVFQRDKVWSVFTDHAAARLRHDLDRGARGAAPRRAPAQRRPAQGAGARRLPDPAPLRARRGASAMPATTRCRRPSARRTSPTRSGSPRCTSAARCAGSRERELVRWRDDSLVIVNRPELERIAAYERVEGARRPLI